MSVTVHPIGGFRAYKKINKVEHQFYSFDKCEADAKQAEFELLANEAISNAPKKLFSEDGRFIGFRINCCFRRERRTCIEIRQQITGVSGLVRQQTSYKTIELMWQWIREQWVTFHDLSVDELIRFSNEIKRAKALYEADVFNAKVKVCLEMK